MALTTLRDDLLQEFREERILISEQLELLGPLAMSLRQPAALRLLSSTTLIISEVSCYILSMGGLACVIFMHLIYPFSLLSELFYNPQHRNNIGATNLASLTLAIYAISVIGVVLLFIIGRMAREMRLKNDILNHAGKDIKTITGQHLERKAVLDTIEQRHMLGLSGISPVPSAYQHEGSVNSVINPGYEG